MNELYTSPELKIEVFSLGDFETNCYLLSYSNLYILIDAPPGICSILSKKLPHSTHISSLILTHSHFDHIADAKNLSDKYKMSILIHVEDQGNLINPGSDHIPCYLHFDGIAPTRLLHDNEELLLGNEKWTIIHTPGHSPGSICIYNQTRDLLFSGDTLFKGTYGSISLPTANPKAMQKSLKFLSTLPKTTLVFPGHGGHTSIGKEKWLQQFAIE